MRTRFDQELEALHELLIEMGTLSQRAIEAAATAVEQQDPQLAE